MSEEKQFRILIRIFVVVASVLIMGPILMVLPEFVRAGAILQIAVPVLFFTLISTILWVCLKKWKRYRYVQEQVPQTNS